MLIFMNRKYVHVLYCLSKWIDFVNIFFIVCLYMFRWWWSRYCVRSVVYTMYKLSIYFKVRHISLSSLLLFPNTETMFRPASVIIIYLPTNIFILFLLFIYQLIGLSNKWLMLLRLFFFLSTQFDDLKNQKCIIFN